MNEELGLNWLTFRYRNYMPEIGRFFGVDPIAEDYMTISTYQFAHNSPVWKIELEGLEGLPGNGVVDQMNCEPEVPQNLRNKGVPIGGTTAGRSNSNTAKPAEAANERRTPESPYLSVKANANIGAHTKETNLFMGIGEKLDVGVSTELANIEYVTNGKESFLNMTFAPENDVEAKAEFTDAGITGGVSYSFQVESPTEGKTTVNFGVDPFIFNVPVSEEAPTMEIRIGEKATNTGAGRSAGVSVSIKNIALPDNNKIREAYKSSYNNTMQHPFFKDLDKKN
jgi:RHS repeat-associated protein